MTRLSPRPLLTLTEHPGERRERGGHPPPQIPGVRISPGVQQKCCGGEYLLPASVDVHPRVAQVKQRGPAERSPLRVHDIAVSEVTRQCIWIGSGRSRPHVGIR